MNKLKIRKLGVLSVAKLQALISLVICLLIGIPYGLIFMVFGGAIMSTAAKGTTAAGGSVIVIGLGIMIGFPIMGAIGGFIGGAINALLYNIFAGMVGGIEIEVENVQY